MIQKANANVIAFLRALFVGAMMAACLAGPAFAQNKQHNLPTATEDPQKKKDAEAIDKQYKATLERTRKTKTETTAADPWQNLRDNDDSKTKR
jgi:hypothetical protein